MVSNDEDNVEKDIWRDEKYKAIDTIQKGRNDIKLGDLEAFLQDW